MKWTTKFKSESHHVRLLLASGAFLGGAVIFLTAPPAYAEESPSPNSLTSLTGAVTSTVGSVTDDVTGIVDHAVSQTPANGLLGESPVASVTQPVVAAVDQTVQTVTTVPIVDEVARVPVVEEVVQPLTEHVVTPVTETVQEVTTGVNEVTTGIVDAVVPVVPNLPAPQEPSEPEVTPLENVTPSQNEIKSPAITIPETTTASLTVPNDETPDSAWGSVSANAVVGTHSFGDSQKVVTKRNAPSNALTAHSETLTGASDEQPVHSPLSAPVALPGAVSGVGSASTLSGSGTASGTTAHVEAFNIPSNAYSVVIHDSDWNMPKDRGEEPGNSPD